MINEALENTTPEITANVRTIPGIITMRGCTYAGCKGVIIGPTSDIVNLVHGPIGCSFYAWLTRRNQTTCLNEGGRNYMPYACQPICRIPISFSAVRRNSRRLFRRPTICFIPKAIAVFATCPVGLIGDDIHAVAKKMKDKVW
jgi:nitrogenase molybdenum-iron protein alpha chain